MSKFRTVAWLFLLILVGTGTAKGAQERPNILILMAEDMSSRVAAFGDSVASTPNIDRLAASGVRFPNTFTTAGVCAPSRAAHITGMHQISIGAQHMRASSFPGGSYLAVPPAQVKAYPELLRREGYYTLTNHKLDYQFSTYAAGSGPFTIWDYEGPEPDWKLRAEGQPFFALINFGMTHESRMFPKNVVEQHKKGWKKVTDPADVSVPPYYPDAPLIRQDMAQQYDNVHEMDRMVGLWLERLAADGLADNTIVIWTTDHGDGLPRSKREIYDSGIKVPMVVYWPDGYAPPGAVNGGEDTRLVSFIDFAPSVLSWAGAEVPAWMQGRPVLADPDEVREYIFASKDRLDEMPFRERAVRDGQYKYLLNYRPGEPGGKSLAYREQLNTMQELHKWFDSGRMNEQQAFWFEPRPREELYNIVDDPFEVSNLVEDPAHEEVLERMRQAYSRWRDRVPDLSDGPESEMAQRFWPGGEQPVTEPPVISVKGQHVSLECPTEGASIGYRLGGGGWQVYSGPFAMAEGTVVEAKAVRYGWKESAVIGAGGDAAGHEPVAPAENDFVTLENSVIQAVISPEHGGELSGFAVRFDGQWQELLYRAMDYAKQPGWRGKAPLLWPAVGASVGPDGHTGQYVLDGKELAMPFHGFARDHAWRVVSRDNAGGNPAVVLEMERSGQADANYPFDYRLRVRYQLGVDRLTLVYFIESGEDNQQPMPFSIGNHITFRAPLVAGSNAAGVKFKTDLPDLLVRNSGKVFTGKVVPSPYPEQHSIAELPHRSAISLGGRKGAAEILITDPSGLQLRLVHQASAEPAEPAVRFNLWVDTEAGFFSPEPWIGTQNSLNSGAGLVRIKPGQSWTWQIDIIPSVAEKHGNPERKESS